MRMLRNIYLLNVYQSYVPAMAGTHHGINSKDILVAVIFSNQKQADEIYNILMYNGRLGRKYSTREAVEQAFQKLKANILFIISDSYVEYIDGTYQEDRREEWNLIDSENENNKD